MDAFTDNSAPGLDGRHAQDDDATSLDFIAYRLAEHTPSIVVADARRSWMDETPGRFANRCLPMLIANQAGWFILNSHTVRATWDGGPEVSSLTVEYLEPLPADPPVVSYFGSGILTWRVPILFRTPPEFNLWARGPANSPKMGAYPLEGIVETDWSVATFTMNWMMLTPDQWVVFEEGEPICMLVPQRKHDLEQLSPRSVPISNSPELAAQFAAWMHSRYRFIMEHKPGEWQKDYFRGGPAAQTAGVHRTRLALKPFRRE